MMRLSTFLKLLVGFAVAITIAGYGPSLGFALMASPDGSMARRVAAVGIVILSFLPWLVLTGWSIAKSDEYERHVFLLGIALATAGSMLVFAAYDFMRDSHIVGATEPVPWLRIMFAMWALGTIAASTYYRRAR